MRSFIILLALLLPMQLTWAAMASYYQGENDRVPTHIGHHEHPSVKADKHAGTEKTKAGDQRRRLLSVPLFVHEIGADLQLERDCSAGCRTKIAFRLLSASHLPYRRRAR